MGRAVAAVGGTIRVANNCVVKDGRVVDARVPRRFLPGIQVVEYLRAFLFGRLGWNRLGGNILISAPFALFPHDPPLSRRGPQPPSLADDPPLSARLHRY